MLDVSIILWCLLVLSLDADSDKHEVSLDVECNFKVCFLYPYTMDWCSLSDRIIVRGSIVKRKYLCIQLYYYC